MGTDSTDHQNNPLCYEQQASVPEGVTRTFSCTEELYGNWVSVSKTILNADDLLQLSEVKVYGKSCGEFGFLIEQTY